MGSGVDCRVGMVEGTFPDDVDVDVGNFSRGASGGFELLVSKTL